MPLEKGKISSRQLAYLYVVTIIASAVIFLPAIVAGKAQQDAWLSVLLAASVGLLLAMQLAALASRFPDQNLIQYSQTILGKWPGRILGLVFIWYLIHINAIIIREFGAFLIALSPETPLIVFIAMIVFLSASIIRNGLEVLCRVTEFYFPLLIGMIILVVILLVKEVHLEYFKPVLAQGMGPVIAGSLPPILWFGEVISMAMIIPYLNQISEARGSLRWGVLITGIIFFLVSFFTIGVFGGKLTGHLLFPTFEVTRFISIAQFLERVDAMVMAIWVGGGLIKISTFYYGAVLGTAHLFNLQEYRPVVLPLGLIQIVLAITLFDNVAELKRFLGETGVPFFILLEVGIPLLLLITALVRGLGAKKNEKK